jgi:hypothetical protein
MDTACWPYHARAGKRVPAEADTIAVLDITPLVLQCLKVGHFVLLLVLWLRSWSSEGGGIVGAHSSNWQGGEGSRGERRGGARL